ncbi:MAG TPA: alpha/beta hydrolase [Candidatus Ventrimonas merdavium]|nr:alpha/beta hydrolase [Candidatus Ventrimonas merdavium]
MKVFSETILLPEACRQDGAFVPPAEFTGYLLEPAEEQENERENDGNPSQVRGRKAVILCPGGGYEHLSSREGEAVAMQYLARGCQAFVLRYSLAPARFPRALWELAALTARIRSQSEAWGIDPEQVIVSGFSAGGHLAGCLGTLWPREFAWKPLGLQPEQIRPDGLILCYPVVTAGAYCHEGSIEQLLGERKNEKDMRELISLEKQVGPHMPRTFLWHTFSDQSVPVENSLLLASAMAEHEISLELHIYPTGCHGLSLATEETSGGQARYVEPGCQSWMELAGNWLERSFPAR